MAKLDTADVQSFYMNPSAYSQVKGDLKKSKSSGLRRKDGVQFSSILDDMRSNAADDLGPARELPVSDEAVSMLMDEVRSAGDVLISRPFPDEIMHYKKAVRDFMNYVVKNCYSLEHEAGIQKRMMPGFAGSVSSDEGKKQKIYTKIQVIDKKLEDLAAMLVSSQMQKLKLAARLEEIIGLLIVLLP
jgi:uncharacterized protein YaaR (DUF327 family)